MKQQLSASHSLSFPCDRIRSLFPALNQEPGFTFFDNGAGAQIPQVVFDAINGHLLHCNVQRGGRYAKSMEVDSVIARARESVAALINARHPDEIAFGMNATSFLRMLSLAIGRTLAARNEIIVTDLDHEANIATWLQLEREGARIVWWKMREDQSLHVEDLAPLLTAKTRLVACTVASHALGSIVDVAAVASLAHAAGAVFSVDATFRHSRATTWSAPATRYSALTWVSCGAGSNCSTSCRSSAKTSFLTLHRARSRPAHSSSKTLRAWQPSSAI